MKAENPKYRFPGLYSFTENDISIFKGREKESGNLYSKILLYKTVVLHADSGTGKSSLIQAGLLPRLKSSEENYFPVILQFNEIAQGESVDIVTQFILNKIELSLKNNFNNITSFALLEEQSRSLWKFSKVLEKAGKKLILIFDQFENLQTFKQRQIDQFIEALYELVNPKIPSDVFEKIEKRFASLAEEKGDAFNLVNQSYLFLSKPSVASLLFVIREDKLGVMSLLSDFFPDILKNDFVIRQLSIDSAYDALTIPAAYEGDFESPTFKFEHRDVALSIIHKIADEETGRVDPILLQIIASGLEVNEVILNRKCIIRKEDIPEVSNIVFKYYKDCLDKIAKELLLTENLLSEYKRNILTKFVINERRTLVNSGSIEPRASVFISKLVNIGLIREIPAENNTFYFQLVHDRMIAPIVSDPEIVKANYFEKYLKSVKFANIVAIVVCVPLLLSWIYIESNYFYYSKNLAKLKIEIKDKYTEQNLAQIEYQNIADSVLVNNVQLGQKITRSAQDKARLTAKSIELSAKHEKSESKLLKSQRAYSEKLMEKSSLIKYSSPLVKTFITVANISLWIFIIFFQFARRNAFKHLYNEVSFFTSKRINKYNDIKLLIPLWLTPVPKSYFRSLGPVRPVTIFGHPYKSNVSTLIIAVCFLSIIIIQLHMTYIGYDFRKNRFDNSFSINLLCSLFSLIVAAIWFTPLNNLQDNNHLKGGAKGLSRKDFIMVSIYSVLGIAVFKLMPILAKNMKLRYTGIKKPRVKLKKPKPEFKQLDCKSEMVMNKKSKIIHFFDSEGFSPVLVSIQSTTQFSSFDRNLEVFTGIERLVIKSKPRISKKNFSWNVENIALNFVRSNEKDKAVKILQYGITGNSKSSLRLTDLLASICIRQETPVSKQALDELIRFGAASKDKRLVGRSEKWKSKKWRDKIVKSTKVLYNNIEI